jgi:hypothetical protein
VWGEHWEQRLGVKLAQGEASLVLGAVASARALPGPPGPGYLLIGQDFNMSHRCDRLGSLLPRWTSGYGINLIILFFLDQVARVGQWTTRLPYLKIRTSRYGMSRSLVSILGILGRHVTPL